MIYEGQSGIHNTIRELTRKLDEIIGRQERTLSSIAMIAQAAQGGQPIPAGGVSLNFLVHSVGIVQNLIIIDTIVITLPFSRYLSFPI